MVTTGFSKPYVAEYKTTAGAASNTYANGMLLGRGVNNTFEVDSGEDNNFYCNNIVGETAEAQFTSGAVTVTVDGLEHAAATLILGLPTPISFEVGEEPVQLQGYAGMKNPYVGYGYIRRTMMHGVTGYWPVIHPKVRFKIPNDSAATQEATIDWQTQELTATILRDDTAKNEWKYTSSKPFDTEAEAEAVLKAYFNVADASSAMSRVQAESAQVGGDEG